MKIIKSKQDRSIYYYLKMIPCALELIFAETVAFLISPFFRKDIWLFGEKKTEARDNGYHFYKYIKKKYPQICSYYAISEGSSDYNKVAELGNVIRYDSFRHCILFFLAKYRLCSQIHGVRPFENFSGLPRLYFFKRKGQLQINLKHGISKDFRPDSFDFRKVGFDLYVCGAKPEFEYIKKTFQYPDKNIVLSGFCRFDALHHISAPKKTLLIMPTFRSWLKPSDSSKDTASIEEMEAFKKSDFFKCYLSLLSNPMIETISSEYGYEIVFYLHYTFQPYRKAFEEQQHLLNNIIIAGRDDYDVQQLLIDSSILITDYSSVFFDFAYMHRPLVYYQFDKREYREKHYQEGYFTYERDGFGPVFENPDEVLSYVLFLLKNDGNVENEYMARIRDFFIPYDDHNCDRVYDAIMRLDS